jgi:hypothetical protein
VKSKLLSEFSIIELTIEVKKRKDLLTVMLVMVGIIVCCGIFQTIKDGFGVFSMFPFVFIGLLLNLRNNHVEAKKELESRTI